MIWAECSLFSCSFLFARWIFNTEEIDLPLQARFNSDLCKAFLLAFCLSSRVFNSTGLDWLGLEDKKSSALWSEFFLQRLFLIKGRWFITFLVEVTPFPVTQTCISLGKTNVLKVERLIPFFANRNNYSNWIIFYKELLLLIALCVDLLNEYI